MATNSEAPAGQFDDMQQQRRAGLLGMWLFLATELLLFGGLFGAFAYARIQHSEAFATAAQHLDLTLASINTVILLTSGLTMVFAEQAVHASRQRPSLAFVLTTLVLGLVFLGIKGWEWQHEFQQQLVPILDLPFNYPDPQPDIARLFFGFYFTLTGLHAAHMLVGLVILGVMLVRIGRWRIPERLARQVRIVGLYWSFVDVVWIFVFTTLYLLRG